MWSDNETEIDLLGFQVHSDLIQSVVTDENLLPITVGVFGDWGSGKSSVIKMLERDLQEQEGIACIFFNGWQFEGYDDAKSALIHSILLELGEHTKLKAEIKRKAASLLKRVDWLRLFNIGYQTIVVPMIASQIAATTGTPAVAPVLPVPTASTPSAPTTPTPSTPSTVVPNEKDLEKIDLTELLKENPANRGIIGARQFRRDFEDLIGETNLTSLVILIDDLDRCEPKRLVETLEAIKLFLAVPHVAFVIGADERIVRYAIAKRYETGRVEAEEGRTDRHVDLVTDYLEKLIQVPYHLPRLSPSEIETYMSLLFCQLYLKDNFTIVHDAFLKARRENITGTFGHQQIKQVLQLQGEACPTDLEAELAWCKSIALSLGDILKGNPRQTKRLLNALLLRRKLARSANLDLSNQILVKLMLLEYMHPKLFGQLYQWQAAQQGVPKQLRALEHGEDGEDPELVSMAREILKQESDWEEPSLKTWLQMPPSLENQDLRDYFWITRDRVTGILAGVSTVPLHLRRVLSSLFDTVDGVILSETKSQLGELTPDEQSILLQELANLLYREPGQHDLINTWFELAALIPMASHRLINTLEQIPPSSLDGSVSMKLAHMAQGHPGVREKAEALLRQWQEEHHTLVGRSAKEALKDLARSGV